MSQFVTDTLSAALAALVDRRRKLQAVIAEVDELDRAIREQRTVLKRLGVQTVRAVAAAEPKPAPAAPTSEPREGTNADRALKLLRGHPRGLNTSVIAREAGIAGGSIAQVLDQLARDGKLVKVGRGFWRIADTDHDAAVGSAGTGA